MARGRHELLDVDGAVAERGLGLRARRAERVLEVVGRGDEAHALPSAAGGGLEQHGKPGIGRDPAQVGEADSAVRAGNERHSGSAHRLLRPQLVPHLLDDLRGRPDEDEVVLVARAHERSVLGEEAVAGVHGVAARRLGRGDDVRDAQVALRGRGRADAHRLIGELDVQCVAVGGRVDGDGLDPELVQRADHADGDLASIRDEHSVEHASS